MKVNLLQGRFQPFTLGHMKCVVAAAERGIPTVIAQIETKTADKKHPFTDDDLEKPMRDLVDSTSIQDVIKVKSADIVKIGEEFAKRGYEICSWTCGTDRIDSYQKMADKYHDKAGLTDDFTMIEIKRGDEDISATKVRNAILADDKKTFEKLTPQCMHRYYSKFRELLKKVNESSLSSFLKESLGGSMSDFLCESQVNEGGASGHMKHIIDYDELTLDNLKGIVYSLFSGRIEKITEKVDGTNIQAGMNDRGEVIFVRNNGDLQSERGGMSIEDMVTKWAGKDRIQKTFVESGKTLEQVFRNLGPKFFNPDSNTRLFLNCECMIEGTTNIMPYISSKVNVHDIWIYKKNADGRWEHTETTKSGLDKVERAMADIDNAQLTPEVIIDAVKASDKLVKWYMAQCNAIFKSENLGYKSTIRDYKQARFRRWMSDNAPWAIDSDAGMGILYDRVVDGVKTVNIRDLKKMYPGHEDELNEIEKSKAKEIAKYTLKDLDDLFLRMSNEVISITKGFINDGHEAEVIRELEQNLKDTIDDIKSDSSTKESTKTKLVQQLERLANLDNKINAAEGIVFQYKGKLMKLTGSFSPLNAVLGLRFER